MTHIPDEAVERALEVFGPGTQTEEFRRRKMRAALEASNAVFLIDEEQKAILVALEIYYDEGYSSNPNLESAQEKLR